MQPSSSGKIRSNQLLRAQLKSLDVFSVFIYIEKSRELRLRKRGHAHKYRLHNGAHYSLISIVCDSRKNAKKIVQMIINANNYSNNTVNVAKTHRAFQRTDFRAILKVILFCQMKHAAVAHWVGSG